MNSIPQRGAFFDVPAATRPLDVAAIPAPPADFPARESALRGKYLATQSGLCIECHTVHQHGLADEIDTTKFFQGGEDFSPFFATTLMIKPVSANLTSDVATGLGSWSTADILKALQEGKDKDGNGICPPMPLAVYATLKTEDATDIANYIKSLPAATNAVADVCSFPPAPQGDGGMSEAGSNEAGYSDAHSVDPAPDSPVTDAAAE
jgi:cytochrome c553